MTPLRVALACLLVAAVLPGVAEGQPLAQAPTDAGALDAGLASDAGADAGDAGDVGVGGQSGSAGSAAGGPDTDPDETPEDAGAPAEPTPTQGQLAVEVPQFRAEDKLEHAAQVLWSIVGLLALLVLAYIGAHPRVRRVERQLGLSSAITAGLPFVALGLAARHPAVGILTDDAIAALSPLLQFGLGWLGFLVGTRLHLSQLESLPRSVTLLVIAQTTIPFLCIALVCGGAMLAFGVRFNDATFLRDGLVLATAGAMTSPVAMRLLARSRSQQHPLIIASELDEIAGVVGLAVLAAYFRPVFLATTWAIPGTAWLFVTLGMGLTVGIVIHVILRRPATPSEFLAIALGSVAFTAGLAAYLHLSPVVVSFVAGVVVANVPGNHRTSLVATLRQLERPIYLVFLVLAGAFWNVADWRGWVLMLTFVLSRFAGLAIAARVARRKVGDALGTIQPSQISLAPLSVMSIAIVVSAQSLYRGRTLPWIVTAVIGGAMATEIISQIFRRFGPDEVEPSVPDLAATPAHDIAAAPETDEEVVS